MEVMGRHCGYLALVAAIVSEADFVFIPEWPPASNWPMKLCKKLIEARDSGDNITIFFKSNNTFYNRRTCIRHQCRKTIVLRCHRCLINTVIEKMNTV
jgi:6-phosphofructokinase